MKSMHKIAAALSLVTSLGVMAPSQAADNSANTPSVVIVHGAFADGSDWAKVVKVLLAKGIKVQVVQNGLESLAGDVATTRRIINNQPGKVVLVGHSWGGTVISEAGDTDKVVGLVYVAAFAPDAGQATGDLGKEFPPAPGITRLVADSQHYLSLPPDAVAQDFAQDVPAEQAAVMAATQGPINAAAFGEKTSVAAWQGRPNWYIVSANDRMIQPDLERAFARKIGAHVTTLPTSHVPQQSRPDDVAKVIIEAVRATSK